ncbi:glycosyltransferase family 4 protein [Phaeocystidibacter luteus]|uniref:Glycosyltransferase family 4 protein n=1 Tax=Phaeocystidibacter luteus TaxID=911197 RepID=A0A6N6RMR2_9FLAO|nr:glycosyltransferase family 1 protein [Phaeocystidibacter luteus]KAB2814838.1 glycosyltransferase family 4 protein [Phaeocystidibacter luteus]
MRRIGIEAQRIMRKDKHGMDMVVINQIKQLMAHKPEGFEFFIYINGVRNKTEWPDVEGFHWRSFEASYPVWEQNWLPKAASEDNLDLLHCTSNTAPVYGETPLAVTVHDIIYYDIYPLFAKGFTPYQRFGNMYRRWNVKRVIKKAKWVATVSNFEAKRIANRFPKVEGKLHTLYNAVSDSFKPAPKEVCDTLRSTNNLLEPFFLFLGNTDPKKNTAGALKAFALALKDVPDMKMVVADLDEQFIRKVLGSDADRVMENIKAVGYIPNEELHVWMTSARFFLYPSLRESFGIPIIEGMASGTPVITSNTTCMPEVSGGAAPLINPSDPSEIAEVMLNLWSDPEERQKWIAKGLERAKVFSWQENVKQLLELYKS